MRTVARIAVVACLLAAGHAGAAPTEVQIPSLDSGVSLKAYVFSPLVPSVYGAIVMQHGCGGAYSPAASPPYGPANVASTYVEWGGFWSRRGFHALLVDGFTTRGVYGSVCDIPYEDRPPSINEVTKRPLDAYGALEWLQQRPDVASDRVALQGWSNGGSSVLSTLAQPGLSSSSFAAALAFYPGCGLQGLFGSDYVNSSPLALLVGTADSVTPPWPKCYALLKHARRNGGRVKLTAYAGAEHGFDRVAGEAKDSAMREAYRFLEPYLR